MGQMFKGIDQNIGQGKTEIEETKLSNKVLGTKDVTTVRDLDDWKEFQKTKVKAKTGENKELIMRVFKLTGDKQTAYYKKYEEFILRQKITPKESIKEIFVWEQGKNDLVLNSMKEEDQSLTNQTMILYVNMHQDRYQMLAIN